MSMSLSLDKSERAAFLRFCTRFCRVSTGSAATGPIRLRLSKTVVLFQVNSIIRYFARSVNREAELLGSTPSEQALIAQWMEYALGVVDGAKVSELMSRADKELLSRTYIAANRPTLADAALFWVFYPAMKTMNPKQAAKLKNLCRWFDLLQHTVDIRGFPNQELVQMARKDFLLLA